MDLKFKRKDKTNENRKSLVFLQDAKRVPDLPSKIPIPSLTSRGNESSRILYRKSKPDLKKSSSQCSSDLQKLFQNHLKFSKENKDPTSKSKRYTNKLLELPQRSLPTSKLFAAPLILPQVSTKFYYDLCRQEPRLANFYIKITE